jgi:hypothetical protein
LACVHVSHFVTFGGEFVEAGVDVIAEDHGYFEVRGQFEDSLGAGYGVYSSGVGYYLDVFRFKGRGQAAYQRWEVSGIA